MKSCLLILALAIQLVSLAPARTEAQWIRTAAAGNDTVYCIKVLGSQIFAGVYSMGNTEGQSGVFLSTNDGATWTLKNLGLLNTHVLSLEYFGSYLLAGTEDGIFCSDDFGFGWLRASGLSLSSRVYSIKKIGVTLYSGVDAKVYKSDLGIVWTYAGGSGGLDSLLTAGRIVALAGWNRNIFAGSDGLYFGGLDITTDNGTSWTSLNAGLADTSIKALAVIGKKLFAGTLDSGVLVSSDSGVTWTSVNSGLSNLRIRSLFVNGANLFSGTAAGGLFISTDSGATWSSINDGLPGVDIRAMEICGANLLVGTQGAGVWKRPVGEFVFGTPIQISPANRSANQPLNSTLVWSAAFGATSYRVQVSSSAAFTDTLFDDSTVVPQAVVGPLATTSYYYWRVYARNAAGPSPWSPVWSFRTVPPVPAAPTLVSPSNNSVNQPLSLTLAWNTPSGYLTLQLQVSTSPAFADTVLNDTTLFGTSANVGPLTAGTTYYWRLNAKNQGGRGEWSEVWNFTTLPLVPAAPMLVSPAHHDTVRADSVVLRWDSVSAAVTRYWLEISQDSVMSSPSIDSTLTDTTATARNLSDNSTYYWRVRACNSAGWGAFSQTRRFLVRIPSTGLLPEQFEVSGFGMAGEGGFIRYALPYAARVSVRLYDILGREVLSAVNRVQPAGRHSLSLSGNRLSTGIYVLRFRAGDFEIRRIFPVIR